MLDEFLKEIEDLKLYKAKYEYGLKDKQILSGLLFELMFEKYNNTSVEDRMKHHKETTCRRCRFHPHCGKILPENIEEPNRSDKAWIPSIQGCSEFEWD